MILICWNSSGKLVVIGQKRFLFVRTVTANKLFLAGTILANKLSFAGLGDRFLQITSSILEDQFFSSSNIGFHFLIFANVIQKLTMDATVQILHCLKSHFHPEKEQGGKIFFLFEQEKPSKTSD